MVLRLSAAVYNLVRIREILAATDESVWSDENGAAGHKNRLSAGQHHSTSFPAPSPRLTRIAPKPAVFSNLLV
jgi:hypothetical protein